MMESSVPPGFRFHPTDEELVDYYLRKKVASQKIDLDVIRDIDLYRIEPWDFQDRCRIGYEEQKEWYFFSHKDKKYPTGTRTNRATMAGFWKATGRDKAVYDNKSKLIGMRKTLVFYKGRAPNGQKTDWIMHEYRLESDHNEPPQASTFIIMNLNPSMSIVPVQSALQPSVVGNGLRPDADPPDPGRHNDPMSASLVYDMEVSSPDIPAPTLALPDPALHDTPPVSSSPSPLLPASAVPLSYKDKLLASNPPLQVGSNAFSDAEDVTLVDGDVTRSTVDDMCTVGNSATAVDTTTSVPPKINSPPMANEAFGPWMKVERRQRRVVRKETSITHDDSEFVVAKSRFNPIFEDDTTDKQTDRPTSAAVEPIIGLDPPSLPIPAASDSRGKGKTPASSSTVKHRSPTSVRKPLVVQRTYAASSSKSGPLPSRRNSSLSNTRFTPFPRPPARLNKGNHSAVVVSESDDPVILTDSAASLRNRDPSVTPLVPNTLLGAVKPPNLAVGHVQSLVQPIVVADSQNAPSMPALPKIQDHRPTLLGLVEPRISGARANLVIAALGFPHSYRVEASGSVYMLSLVYASPSASRRKGDRNTSYFHRKARQRKIRNRIVSLQLPDGTWCDDEQVLRTQAASFFQLLFSDPDVSSGSYSISGCFPPIPRPYMDSLTRIPSPQEVARSSGVGRILVQSDCSHATKLLIDALQPSHGVLQQDHELPLVRAIVFLCQEDWQEEGWVVCRAFKKRSTGGQAKSIGGGWDSSYFYDEPSGLSSVVDPMEYMSRQPQSFLPLCKQETATEADNLNNFVYSHQFIELPPLESPSLPLMNKPITISIVSENNNINYEEGGEEDQRRMCNSSTTKKVTDWRTLDKFVASQLSHEDRYNNGGDQQGPGAASISSFDANSCSNSDMALLLLQSSREEGNKLKELLSWSSDCDIGICMFDK
ncbi:hypothetical protein V6N13_044864 [Hibiscus sabdariffa]